MRVIGGTARGTVLYAPIGLSTRPTADRAREGLFNILRPIIRGAAFLDLFAGTGAVGIEAVSQGAIRAVFVDSSPAATDAINKNIKKTRFEPSSKVIKEEAFTALKGLAAVNDRFDIIFADPPYNQGLCEKALCLAGELNMLNEGGLFIAETAREENIETDMICERRVVYGAAAFWFFRHNSQRID